MSRKGRASSKNRAIKLQAPTKIPNGQGGFAKGWTDGIDAWAEMIPLRGSEAIEQNIQRSVQLWRVAIRWRQDVDTTWRIVHDGKFLNIRSCADAEGTRQDLVMTCESGVLN